MQIPYLTFAILLDLYSLGSAQNTLCKDAPDICAYGVEGSTWLACGYGMNWCQQGACKGRTKHHCCRNKGAWEEYCY
ncbi:putative transporter [Venturia inaequalis]|nr:putative transporter [Venturia inaequalis]